ncbi:hypothetical protein CEUSTIGMA_g6421.t1 [Chlamydomonas eustigma]|uniref:Protein odr-4 homolog n=1 Tax=Chlamydomonas eustigma TaxID=1157962 RepID=A0A250X7C1_9CHLO|nr:hypothetical protein CEUSTIGMA_g6421.t1 [Chlamydomonas eustigma]|eukprot:GAX78981.1 hypothetical protein CEUSTIGMA_g6421.t1 [Chlamydomonas eustigma]
MVHICQAETEIQEHFHTLIKNRISIQVGLIVGKPNVGSRDLLVALIKTPQQDGNDAASCSIVSTSSSQPSRSNSKSKPSASKPGSGSGGNTSVNIHIDTQSMTEHATQVIRMLPGGLHVLGAYVFCPESGFNSASIQVSSALPELCGSLQRSSASELLMLYADSMSGKVTMKSSKSSGFLCDPASLRPCDLKFVPCVPNLMRLTCRHHVQVQLPVCKYDERQKSQQQMKDLICLAVEAEGIRLKHCVAVVQGSGNVPLNSTQAMDVCQQNNHEASGLDSKSCGQVQFLTPLAAFNPSTACQGVSSGDVLRTSKVQGFCRLSGFVFGLAYVAKRESFGRAVDELKADVEKSLQSRLDLMMDDVFSWQEEQLQEQADRTLDHEQGGIPTSAADKKSASFMHPLLQNVDKTRAVFPLLQRVLLPWKNGLLVGDYLCQGEAVEDSAARASELLELDPGITERIILIEDQSMPPSASSESSDKLLKYNAVSQNGNGKNAESHNLNSKLQSENIPKVPIMAFGMPVAFAVAALSIVLYLILNMD